MHEDTRNSAVVAETRQTASKVNSLLSTDSAFADRLIRNLLSPSLKIKSASVRLLQFCLKQNVFQNILSVAIEILDTPVSLQTVRKISMFIRRLLVLQKPLRADPHLRKFCPYFLLGLLSSQVTPTVHEITSALSALCEDSNDEDSICEVLIECLQTQNCEPEGLRNEEKGSAERPHGPLSSLQSFQDEAQCSTTIPTEGQLFLDELVLAKEEDPGNITCSISRLQVLQVFQSIPQAAEKRSHALMPVFLSMRSSSDAKSLCSTGQSTSLSNDNTCSVAYNTSSFPERKAFLELLGRFKNPISLFASKQVYQVLLEFLTVAQTQIQKLALKALFTWKLPTVRKYDERLVKLVDSATYCDELTSLFQADAGSSNIQEEDRGQVMPILLRVLFGQMTNRAGSKRGHSGQEAKRKTTIRVLSRLRAPEISEFLDIAFGDVAIHFDSQGTLDRRLVLVNHVSVEKRYGLVKSAESLLETLRSQLSPYGERILRPVLFCLYRSCQAIDAARAVEGDSEPEVPKPILRSIRKIATHCLCMMFQFCDGIRWPTYLPSIFEWIVRPRLEHLATKASQGVSVLLRLFGTWASDASSISYLHEYEPSLLDKLADCVANPTTRDEVKVYIMDQVFLKIIKVSREQSDYSTGDLNILECHSRHLLGTLRNLLESKAEGKVLHSAVALLVGLTAFAGSSSEGEEILAAITHLLGEPPKRIGPKVKSELLQAVISLLQPHEEKLGTVTKLQLRYNVALLFEYFLDSPNRQRLAKILGLLAHGDESAKQAASLCSSLNAASSSRLDEIDYDTRLEAFTIINATKLEYFSAELWDPIIRNLLFFVRMETDLAIRSNATSSLRQFVHKTTKLGHNDFDMLLQSVILEAVKKSVKADSETIRADHVALFGLLVQSCPHFEALQDMQGLLAGNDEEASFFNNILHIQYHRRTRAIRRLTAEAETGVLRSSSICNFFLPLLEKFVFDTREEEAARNLKGQAIVAIGSLLQWTEWNQFRAIFKRYKGYLESRPGQEKDVIKLLGASTDALVGCSPSRHSLEDAKIGEDGGQKSEKLLLISLPSTSKVCEELSTKFIPELASFIHQKDEAQITSRVPVAIAVVKLLSTLPEAQMALFLPSVLLDVAYILRSRSQDARDMVRRTLAEVTTVLGPAYIHWIIKELRTALSRGYQLHVLSFTLHSLLVSLTDRLRPGDLDHCLDEIVSVIMDDIFGVVGQEKEAQDYISSMREVKNSKSFDSMELLAKSTTINHVMDLIRPLLLTLTGTITPKQLRQVDELLRRIGSGLSRNVLGTSRELLIFVYQLVEEVYKQAQPGQAQRATNDEINQQKFLVQLSTARKTIMPSSTPSPHKLAKFAIDLLRSTLQKNDSLLTSENIHGFLPVLGDAIVQRDEDVKISAMRTLSAVMRLPMPELDENAGLYLREATRAIRDAVHTNSEGAQAALKLIAAILRERKAVQIRDSDLAYLLQRIIPDLDEPDRQGVSFNFIRAVMRRKVMLPEVYDASNKIGLIMVTDQGSAARDVARGVFVHFLLEYSQTKGRWAKQIKFLAKNLSYKYPEGRQSVMEAINTLLNKVGLSTASELVSQLFIPLVLIMANDENLACRQMAGALLGRCFAKVNSAHLESLATTLETWMQQRENPILREAGLQTFKILLENPETYQESQVATLLLTIDEIAQEAIRERSSSSFALLYHALQLLLKLVVTFPNVVLISEQCHLWTQVRALLVFPHPWIRLSSAELIGVWFRALANSAISPSLNELPLVNSRGLRLTKEAQLDVLQSSLGTLKSTQLSKEMIAQTVENLLFLGRCFVANQLEIDQVEYGLRPRGSSVEGVDAQSMKDKWGGSNDSGTLQDRMSLAITYLYTQLCRILHHEPRTTPTTSSLLPKHAATQLLSALIKHHDYLSSHEPILTTTFLSSTLFPPLAHLTDPTLPTPHRHQYSSSSSDPAFASSYSELRASAAELLDSIRDKVGNDVYVPAMTEAQQRRRQKREIRRTKRKMDALRDPERAAREKRRKFEKEKRRKKNVKEEWRRGRKGF